MAGDSGALRVAGLISGTSVDGIDVAVAELSADGGTLSLAPLGHLEVPYPASLRTDLLAALPPGTCDAGQLTRLDTGVGQAFAEAAALAIDSVPGGYADLVASLGQTIFHWVENGRALGTMQLGQPAWIAERTGLPVVADLRARDIAAGGHGAPLASTLDALWLRGLADERGKPAAALNIGGIANLTVVPPTCPQCGFWDVGCPQCHFGDVRCPESHFGDVRCPQSGIGGIVTAYDTGPGNALLDLGAARVTGGAASADVDGALAARGTVRADLLARLLADPYYAADPPKSTGKEHFHATYLDEALAGLTRPVDGADLLATLTELTAVTIADACGKQGVDTVLVSGGGVRNPVLLASLGNRLTVRTSDDEGLPADGKEAYLAAVLGWLTWHGLPANVPSATGATGTRLLGSITPGAGPLSLPGTTRSIPNTISQIHVTNTRLTR